MNFLFDLFPDEATSSLDAETERLVQDALDELIHGRTTFIIAHRLSTVVNADRILVLKDGRILEEGKHETLMHQNGYYASLVKHKTRGFFSSPELVHAVFRKTGQLVS